MEKLNEFQSICKLGENLHDIIYADLNKYFEKKDAQKKRTHLRLVKNVLTRIFPIRKRMLKSGINYDYELKVLDWIERYVAQYAFLPLSFHVMLTRWQQMFGRGIKPRICSTYIEK